MGVSKTSVSLKILEKQEKLCKIYMHYKAGVVVLQFIAKSLS